MTHFLTFTCALHQLHTITWSFDWFNGMAVSFNGKCKYFWIWFHNTQLKPAPNDYVYQN